MTVAGHTGDALITEEALAQLRSRMGVEFETKPWNTVAAPDSIRHFAEGVGDDNPLFMDADRGKSTSWAAVIAPPTYLNSFSNASFSGARAGLPGVFALWAGDIWEFNRPTRDGDHITATEKLIGADERDSRWGGRSIHQILQTTYRESNGQIIGTRIGRIVRAERSSAREQSKYAEATGKKYRYTEEALAAIGQDYDTEQVRGAEPRYWEDVEVGDDLGHVVKGPLTSVDMVTFVMGWGSPLCKAHRIAHHYMKRHPGSALIDPETNVRVFPEAAHWDEALAQRSGVGAGYDIGEQRIAWFGHLLTNWMGDEGFLKRLEVRLLRPNFMGDTTWVRGTVTEKLVRDNAHLVACELTGDDQRGTRNSDGRALVWLPSREGGTTRPGDVLRQQWGW
jgi:acyl dehydratase